MTQLLLLPAKHILHVSVCLHFFLEFFVQKAILHILSIFCFVLFWHVFAPIIINAIMLQSIPGFFGALCTYNGQCYIEHIHA